MEVEQHPAVVGAVSAENQGNENDKAKHWVFTWNNPAANEAPQWHPDKMAYMVYQLEKGANGTTHYQGYIRFKGQQRFKAVKNLIGTNAVHIAKARGTEEQNRNYCTKEDTRQAPPVEQGTFQGSANRKGNRSDLADCTDMLNKGASLKEVALAHPEDFVRYGQGLQRYQQTVAPKAAKVRINFNVWIYGPTRIGKTWSTVHAYNDPYQVVPGRDPWSGYQGEKVVIFDEFNLEKWEPQAINRYADVYALKLDCRYFDKHANWNLCIFITNSAPEYFFRNVKDEDLQRALMARFQHPYGRIYWKRHREDVMPLPPDPEKDWATFESVMQAIPENPWEAQ